MRYTYNIKVRSLPDIEHLDEIKGNLGVWKVSIDTDEGL